MKIAVIDDYQDAFRKVKAFAKLKGHEVITYTDSEKDPVKFGKRVEGCEAVVLTQQRSFMPRAIIEKLPASVKLLAQTGRNVPHIDAAACTEPVARHKAQVAVKAAAGDAAVTVTQLPPGTQVRIIEISSGWAFIARDGQKLVYVQGSALARLQ